jgi:hypothetical protein
LRTNKWIKNESENSTPQNIFTILDGEFEKKPDLLRPIGIHVYYDQSNNCGRCDLKCYDEDGFSETITEDWLGSLCRTLEGFTNCIFKSGVTPISKQIPMQLSDGSINAQSFSELSLLGTIPAIKNKIQQELVAAVAWYEYDHINLDRFIDNQRERIEIVEFYKALLELIGSGIFEIGAIESMKLGPVAIVGNEYLRLASEYSWFRFSEILNLSSGARTISAADWTEQNITRLTRWILLEFQCFIDPSIRIDLESKTMKF